MKTILMLAFTILAFMPQGHAKEENKDIKTPAVKAVVFYAANCGSCKILEPRMEQAMKAINMDTVEVVKFDFSSKETIAATRELAVEQNVNDVLMNYGAKTGFVVLLDQDGNEVNKLTVNDEAADIASKIVKAVVEAS